MEEDKSIVQNREFTAAEPNDEIQCTHCLRVIPEPNKFCENCGFPQHGTASEKAHFHATRVISHSKSKEAPKVIRQARNTLFIISGITFLYGVFYYFTQDDLDVLITSFVLFVVYVTLGFWSQKKPLVALVLGLLVYLTTLVINGIVDPSTIYKGVILKGIIIFFLGKGINSALHLRNAD